MIYSFMEFARPVPVRNENGLSLSKLQFRNIKSVYFNRNLKINISLRNTGGSYFSAIICGESRPLTFIPE
jgi:hypothetical protein